MGRRVARCIIRRSGGKRCAPSHKIVLAKVVVMKAGAVAKVEAGVTAVIEVVVQVVVEMVVVI